MTRIISVKLCNVSHSLFQITKVSTVRHIYITDARSMWEQLLYTINKQKKNKRKPNIKNKKTAYYLGNGYPGVKFTVREAECMVCFLRGYTIYLTGRILNISARTVEAYLANMKNKLGCRTKLELTEKIRQTHFMEHVAELEQRILQSTK